MPAFKIKADRDQLTVDKLTGRFGPGSFTHERLYDTLCFTVPKEHIHDVLAFLRDELDFNFLTSL
ncbi:MAG TPA: hypothetical protein PLV70_01550, partial [Flavobacteriales bacterium]|nr:hypothetical protein [Flavobacteriales bacterium]